MTKKYSFVSAPVLKARILGFWFLIFLTASCKQPFSFKEVLDEPVLDEVTLDDSEEEQIPLYILPDSVTLYIGSTFTFYVAGGTAPYTFSVSGGSGTITDEGVYTAPSSAGTETVSVADSQGETVTASITVTDEQLDADYYVVSITNSPSVSDVGSLIGQSFVFANQGSDAGALQVYWSAYISDDTELDGGDTLAASGLVDPLDPAESSLSIPISGNWPVSGGVYYLIVRLSSADDRDPSNNYGTSAAFTINASSSDIDYVVSSITTKYPTVSMGSLCGETFKISNIGGMAGASVITWSAYASTDLTIDGGDTLIDSDSTSFAGLASGETSSNIAINGHWPSTAGSYYLLVQIASADETITTNNIGSQGIFEVLAPPDYTITNVVFQAQGTTGQPLSDDGIYTFEVSEISGNDGSQPIGYEVFYSLDSVLDGSDVSLLDDSINALTASSSSVPISFADVSWPDMGAYYFIIIQIESGDDSDSLNNLYVTPTSITVPEVYTEDASDNSSVGPTTVALTNVTDIIVYGGAIETAQLVHIDGLMDDNPAFDTYRIQVGSISTLEMYITWSTGDDAINFYLWDEANGQEYSDDNREDSEPLVPTPPAKMPVTPNSTYYIGVEFLGTDAGTSYQIILHGK